MSNIYLDKDAREGLMRGVDAVTNAVKLTLGASGGNAVLQDDLPPGHLITNDGKSIAERCQLDDPIEQIGANLVKETTLRSDNESGDGTTTTCVLLQAILEEGMKIDASPMDIKRSLDECLPIILKSIDDQKKDITVDDVAAVATVSAEDPKMGALIQEIYQVIGKDGIIELDTSNIPETSYEITDGVRLRNAGFMYPYMANDPKGTTATYKNPLILITKQKIATLQDLDKIFKALNDKGVRELVIFCDEIDVMVSQGLAQTHNMGVFKTLVIQAPKLWKDWIYEDFAKITGSSIVDPSQGKTFKNLQMTDLGTCEQITSTKHETVVRGIRDITAHIEAIKAEATPEALIRASWLQTKTAVLKLGANSDSELSYIRLKAEDARNAAYLALQDGVVAGGGIAFANCAWKMPDTIGGLILKEALLSPINQIIENSGVYKGTQKFEISDYETESGVGFDTKSLEWVNMWDAGIVDPAKVVKNAIRNAISVAGTVLTARVVVVKKP